MIELCSCGGAICAHGTCTRCQGFCAHCGPGGRQYYEDMADSVNTQPSSEYVCEVLTEVERRTLGAFRDVFDSACLEAQK